MFCWNCGKKITELEDQYNCDLCDIPLCRECYSKENGMCNDCNNDCNDCIEEDF